MTARCGSGSRRCGAGSVHDTAASRNPKIELIKAVRERIGVADPGSLRATAPGGSVAKRSLSIRKNRRSLEILDVEVQIKPGLRHSKTTRSTWMYAKLRHLFKVHLRSAARSSAMAHARFLIGPANCHPGSRTVVHRMVNQPACAGVGRNAARRH